MENEREIVNSLFHKSKSNEEKTKNKSKTKDVRFGAPFEGHEPTERKIVFSQKQQFLSIKNSSEDLNKDKVGVEFSDLENRMFLKHSQSNVVLGIKSLH